ncbi:MAG: hypothetical protein IT445_17320 [Phycisphaeraceae bacterium]|nr:hypothetical protein [Phycisphaeraceae bacterium]
MLITGHYNAVILLGACIVLSSTATVCAQSRLVVVAFGDSTTAARLVEGKKINVYVDLLEKSPVWGEAHASIVNAGKPSDTTAGALERLQTDVLSLQPHLVIIQFGINDAAVDVWKNPPAKEPRVPLSQYRDNLRTIATSIQSQGGQVIIMTPNPLCWTDPLRELYGKPPFDPQRPDGLNVLLSNYAQAARDLAKELNVPLVDIYTAYERYYGQTGRQVDELLLDGMHPNDKGHRLVCDELSAVIGTLPLVEMAKDNRPRPRVAENGAVIHPAACDMPQLPMGPFIRLGDNSILTVKDTDALISRDEGRT